MRRCTSTSYEGDLLARLGVPHAAGRETTDLYGEAWAGRQPAYRPGKHNFPVTLSPFADDNTLLPFVRAPELDERGWPAELLGKGDSYRSRTPRREDAENLLLPVCLSASHVAFGSVRMEPRLMLLGHAAGLAAAQASRRGVAVQDVDVPALQHELREQGQVVAL